MMPGLPLSSIPQCKLNRHNCEHLESFQAIGSFEPNFIQADQGSNRICKVRLLESRTKTRSFLEDIITTRNEVFTKFQSGITVEI